MLKKLGFKEQKENPGHYVLNHYYGCFDEDKKAFKFNMMNNWITDLNDLCFIAQLIQEVQSGAGKSKPEVFK